MSSTQRLSDIKAIPKDTAERREAVREYLKRFQTFGGLHKRAAKKAKVHETMVSKVLHGTATSAPVEKVIEFFEAKLEAEHVSAA